MTYKPKYSGVNYDNNGMERHYAGGCLHRTDGPAVISSSGATWFYIHGNHFTFLQWCSILNKTPLEITALKITYSIT